jgi:NADH-quinone oxidoreductase subunit E
LLEKVERSLNVNRGETTEDKRFTLETVNCMGACALGPVLNIDGKYYGQMSTEKVDSVLEEFN